MQAGQEPRRIVDVLVRVEHVANAAKMRGMVVVIDLHAAEVDQNFSIASCRFKRCQRLVSAFREDSFSFYIQGISL